MKTLVVFNGGRDGCLLLTNDSAIAVPPLETDARLALKATAALTMAMAGAANKGARNKLSTLAIGSANLAVELVEGSLGALNPDRAIVYQDDDGGFTCGSTGKPPIPVPWPPGLGEPGDLVKRGIIEADVLEVIRTAKARGMDFTKLFEAPAATAKELGVPLSPKGARELGQLAPSRTSELKDPVDREVVGLFHAVLKDGRFIEDWFRRPVDVARALKVKLSDKAIEQIISISSAVNLGKAADDFGNYIAAGVVWAGVCIAVGTLFVGQMNPLDTLIRDRSGTEKF
jgi:hypothetical protein